MKIISDRIEIARNILHNAVMMNMRREIIFKISQKFDEYVVEYFNEDSKE